jgi:hypothetical protein
MLKKIVVFVVSNQLLLKDFVEDFPRKNHKAYQLYNENIIKYSPLYHHISGEPSPSFACAGKVVSFTSFGLRKSGFAEPFIL